MNQKFSSANHEPNLALAKRLNIGVYLVSFVVLLLVGLMRRIQVPLPDGVDLGFLPAVHATLNSIVAILLVTALVMIKKRNIKAHVMAINGAMICSAAFLLCYVQLPHHHTGDVFWRPRSDQIHLLFSVGHPYRSGRIQLSVHSLYLGF